MPSPNERGRDRAPRDLPWAPLLDGPAPAFCVLWTTGPDTGLDGVFRFQALRADGAGGWKGFDRYSNPFGDASETGAATARMMREFGTTAAELEGCEPAAEVWTALADFLGDAPLLVPDAEAFEAWRRHFEGAGTPRPCVGLSELVALVLPGRLAGHRDELAAELSEPAPDRPRPSARAIGPRDLQAALTELARRFLALDRDVLALAARGYAQVARALQEHEPQGALRLCRALALLERPGAWAATREGELPLRPPPADGLLAAAAGSLADGEEALDELDPRWATEGERWAELPPLPPASEVPLPFPAEDLAQLDDVFQVHLARAFAGSGAAEGAREKAAGYRESQHAVAREVARALGGAGQGPVELLLVHAPTGTGKTLAYLVPALLWARRHEVRVGVATYTRALQEQAMDREVPRALAALRAAGEPLGYRVSVLKGRANYLCWRALRLHEPEPGADGEERLAWLQLALFALTDTTGDLDRLPLRAPVALESSRSYEQALRELLHQVRAQTSCCTHASDRRTCGAEVARLRAERSHVVLTNHSFALARREFFRNVIFDECEHLHDQAHAAWSHSTSLRAIGGLLDRIHKPARGRRGRAVLERVERRLAGHEAATDSWSRCVEQAVEARGSLADLTRELEAFTRWRDARGREREQRDRHSLLREYADGEEGAELVARRRALSASGARLDAGLAELAEHLDGLRAPGLPRVRRALELARADLRETIDAVDAWIPVLDGAVRFGAHTFHDVERDPAGDLRLAARVLLPNEYLGRYYYPELQTGVFLSATTWLRGGFESATAYLGLDRAVEPAPDEEREPCTLRTFRAPEVFDYGRVVVCVPRDAPSVARDKDAFLAWVRDFVARLGERTRGRMLVLLTNAEDTKRLGRELEGFFRARRVPLWYQNMQGGTKEELSELFRRRVDSILLGVDTFWYGADFPGNTLEYLVIVKLPYGVPDDYHYAQCAALGAGEQRRRIYMPRALAKFRQGFGRLMRRVSDRGCVFLLDGRVLEPRHRIFLRELPLRDELAGDGEGARLVRGDAAHCQREALAHMGMLADVARRGLDLPAEAAPTEEPRPEPPTRRGPPAAEVAPEDAPF